MELEQKHWEVAWLARGLAVGGGPTLSKTVDMHQKMNRVGVREGAEPAGKASAGLVLAVGRGKTLKASARNAKYLRTKWDASRAHDTPDRPREAQSGPPARSPVLAQTVTKTSPRSNVLSEAKM